MSVAALAVVLGNIAIFGGGTAAHLWQLLMAGQVPVVAWFAAKWVPHSPAQALRVLALQAVAILARGVLRCTTSSYRGVRCGAPVLVAILPRFRHRREGGGDGDQDRMPHR